jgi:uncharacterized LabA/DUF88 family protein
LGPDRYAILLDGSFVVMKLRKKLRRFPIAEDVVELCERIRKHELLSDLKLLRIYFYNAPPYADPIVNPISKVKLRLASSESVSQNSRLHHKLELKPDFALRMGLTVCRGWKVSRKALNESDGTRPLGSDDLIPHIEQKGVDLRIGMDIARLALNRMVSTIVIVSGDSDFVPAFKFARREGLRVFLDVMGNPVRRDLKVHADRVLDVAGDVAPSAIARTTMPSGVAVRPEVVR